MPDTTYSRFVDAQRMQVRWFLAESKTHTSSLAQAALLSSAALAAELAMVGYFAELTQKRYQMTIWRELLAIGANFHNLQAKVMAPPYMFASWREMESDADSALSLVQRAIVQAKTPSDMQYRSSLLSETSLVPQTAVIASSAALPPVVLQEFAAAWLVIDEQINRERAEALEC